MARRKVENPEPPEASELIPQPGTEATVETKLESVQDPLPFPAQASRPDRGWTERLQPPELAYRRFTAKDQTGRSKIFFKFQLPQGQDKPNADALAVVQAHKHSPEGYDTGLRFEDDDIHGKVWKLPNTEIGRATADSIDKGLQEIAVKVEEKGRGA